MLATETDEVGEARGAGGWPLLLSMGDSGLNWRSEWLVASFPGPRRDEAPVLERLVLTRSGGAGVLDSGKEPVLWLAIEGRRRLDWEACG